MEDKNKNTSQKVKITEELKFAALKPRNTDSAAESNAVISSLLNSNQEDSSTPKSD